MAIKNRKKLKESKDFIESLDCRIKLLQEAHDRSQQLEFKQWFKERSKRLPIGRIRIEMQKKIIHLEMLKIRIQEQIDDYCKEQQKKIITDCYHVIDRDTVSVFIYINKTVKEKKLFSYPFSGVSYFDSAEFIGKTLDEAETIKNAKFNLK